MIVPQKSYLPLGSLKGALLYPEPDLAIGNDKLADVAAARGAGALVPRLDEVARWDQVLANGERQRLAVARLLLHKPQVVILDDALSALEDEAQEALLARLKSDLPGTTIVSLAQRPAPDGRHDRQFALERNAARRRAGADRRSGIGARDVTTRWRASGHRKDEQAQLLERHLEPRRGAMPLRRAFRPVPRGEAGQERRHLPLRHGQPPYRRAQGGRGRGQQRRARHHRLAAGVRRLRGAADQEPAARATPTRPTSATSTSSTPGCCPSSTTSRCSTSASSARPTTTATARSPTWK